ncbi:MAG TPA: PDZ domain-containing protein [Candidatus Binatus sp.]|nr:PDZ domain-containing protein [Candidatus Binatus sp.]
MADALRVIVLLALAAPGIAVGAGPCEEARGQTGFAVEIAPAGGLAIAAVDPESGAAASGLAPGDALVQVNGTLPRSCSEYARAVRDARRERKAVLLLVRRGAGELPFAVGAATWDRAVAEVPSPPPAEAPSVRRIVATPPPPLPPDATVTLGEVLRGLSALEPSTRLASYRRDLLLLHRQVETLAARGAAPANVVGGLRTVLGYYDAAAVAWASEDERREVLRQPRHVASSEAATAPYFEGSDVAAAIDEFPFLRDTVLRDPEPRPFAGESAGLWRPRQARALLWEHGREELARFTTWLSAGNR